MGDLETHHKFSSDTLWREMFAGSNSCDYSRDPLK